MTHTNALVIGAGGGLGGAVAGRLLDKVTGRVFAVSRNATNDSAVDNERLHPLSCDYSQTSIDDVCAAISRSPDPISAVCICNGVLHSEGFFPEKRIESLDPESMMSVYNVNAIVPMMWVKSLLPILAGTQQCVVSVFSARVGSISDNRRGGWYSYRASKAALNMLLKTASIEYARRAPNVKLIAFHPGTADTALSKPFQGSVPGGKLFKPAFVADRLMMVIENADYDRGLEFIDWNGVTVEW